MDNARSEPSESWTEKRQKKYFIEEQTFVMSIVLESPFDACVFE